MKKVFSENKIQADMILQQAIVHLESLLNDYNYKRKRYTVIIEIIDEDSENEY